MRILFVSRQMPNPNGIGVERRAAQHLAGLQQLGSVTMVVPPLAMKDAAEQGFEAGNLDLERLITRTEPTMAEHSFARWHGTRNPLIKRWNQLRIRHDQDHTVLPGDVSRRRRDVGEGYDLLFAFRLASAVWIDSLLTADSRPSVAVVDFDDIESVAHSRLQAAEPRASFLGRSQAKVFGRWLRQTERVLSRRWDRTMVCSEQDRDLLARIVGGDPIVSPNSVPYRPMALQKESRPVNVLLVGAMSYTPNVVGARWFADHVWERVSSRLGEGATLTIAGINPKPEILELRSRPGIEVLGWVKDLAPIYARATMAIAPIFSGGGTRIKLIEAMAYTRASVTTTIGCEGLNLTSKEALIANTAETFADAVFRIGTDTTYRKQIAESAWQFGRDRFSAEAVITRFTTDLNRLMKSKKSPQ